MRRMAAVGPRNGLRRHLVWICLVQDPKDDNIETHEEDKAVSVFFASSGQSILFLCVSSLRPSRLCLSVFEFLLMIFTQHHSSSRLQQLDGRGMLQIDFNGHI